MPVLVTETAAREIDAIIRQQDLDPEKIRLRVGVKAGGCSGFSYLLDLTEVEKDSDEMWEYSFVRQPEKSAATVGAGGDGDGADASGGEPYTVRVICDP